MSGLVAARAAAARGISSWVRHIGRVWGHRRLRNWLIPPTTRRDARLVDDARGGAGSPSQWLPFRTLFARLLIPSERGTSRPQAASIWWSYPVPATLDSTVFGAPVSPLHSWPRRVFILTALAGAMAGSRSGSALWLRLWSPVARSGCGMGPSMCGPGCCCPSGGCGFGCSAGCGCPRATFGFGLFGGGRCCSPCGSCCAPSCGGGCGGPCGPVCFPRVRSDVRCRLWIAVRSWPLRILAVLGPFLRRPRVRTWLAAPVEGPCGPGSCSAGGCGTGCCGTGICGSCAPVAGAPGPCGAGCGPPTYETSPPLQPGSTNGPGYPPSIGPGEPIPGVAPTAIPKRSAPPPDEKGTHFERRPVGAIGQRGRTGFDG